MTKKLVQFLIVSDGELKMTGNNTRLLVISCSVPSKFKNFGRKIFEDGRKIDWCTGTNTLGIVSFSEESVDTTDWECKTSLG